MALSSHVPVLHVQIMVPASIKEMVSCAFVPHSTLEVYVRQLCHVLETHVAKEECAPCWEALLHASASTTTPGRDVKCTCHVLASHALMVLPVKSLAMTLCVDAQQATPGRLVKPSFHVLASPV